MEVLQGKGWWDEEQDEDEKYFLSISKRSYYLGGKSDRFDILQYFRSHDICKERPSGLDNFLIGAYQYGADTLTERDRGLLLSSLRNLERDHKIECLVYPIDENEPNSPE